MSAAVIAHGNPSPIFEPAKHNFYFMPLLIEFFVIHSGLLSISFGRNAGNDSLVEQGIAKPISVVASIRKKCFGFRQARKQLSRPLIIAHLSFREEQSNRFSGSVANRMEL